MNILHVTTAFPPAYDYGGPVKSSHKLCKGLVSRGHDVTVYTTDGLDSENRVSVDNPEYIDGIKICRFRNLSNLAAWNLRISTPIGMTIPLWKTLNDFDLVHLHEFRSVENAITATLADLTDTPFIIQPRGSFPRNHKNFQKTVFDTIIGNNMINNTSGLIASSSIESEQFPDINKSKIYYSPNGIDTEDYAELPLKGSFRNKFDIKEEIIILFLGRITERKGLDILIHSFKNLSETIGQARLVIVGPDDGYRKEAEALIEKHGVNRQVTFTGPLYNENKLEAYVDADVFVMPSKNKYESFGNVVLESMACKTPVVVTNVSGVAEWVDNWCVSVPPTTEGILKGLKKIWRNKQIDVEAMRNDVLSRFNWNDIAKVNEGIYHNII